MRPDVCLLTLLIAAASLTLSSGAVAQLPAHGPPGERTWGSGSTPDIADCPWGIAPGWWDDTPEAMAPLPEGFAGWARFLSSVDNYSFVSCANGIVVIEDGGSMFAYQLADGRQLWSTAENEYLSADSFLSSFQSLDVLYVPTGDDVAALGMADGRQIWRQANEVLIAGGTAGAWTTSLWSPDRPGVTALFAEQRGVDLRLRDPADGAVVQEFALGDLYGLCQQVTMDAERIAVATRDAVVVCGAGGSMLELPRARPGWAALLALDEAGFIVAEFPPSDLGFDEYLPGSTSENTAFTPEYETYIRDPQTGELASLVMSYYALPTEELAWRGSCCS